MKKENVNKIRAFLNDGKLSETETLLEEESEKNPQDAEVHYWKGNLQRKQGNFQQALQLYAEAMDLDAESPAREAHAMLMDIMTFYDKERYNV